MIRSWFWIGETSGRKFFRKWRASTKWCMKNWRTIWSGSAILISSSTNNSPLYILIPKTISTWTILNSNKYLFSSSEKLSSETPFHKTTLFSTSSLSSSSLIANIYYLSPIYKSMTLPFIGVYIRIINIKYWYESSNHIISFISHLCYIISFISHLCYIISMLYHITSYRIIYIYIYIYHKSLALSSSI